MLSMWLVSFPSTARSVHSNFRGMYINKESVQNLNAFFCDPARIQTWNLLIRSQMLYSVELRGRLQLSCFISTRYP